VNRDYSDEYNHRSIKGTDKTFDDLKRAYQISFFAGESLCRDKNLVHHFTYYDKQHELSLGGRTKIITIELKKAESLLEKKVREMSHEELRAFFFRYGPDTAYRDLINEIMEAEEGIAMAGEELLTVTEDERLRAWLMSAEKYDLDLQNDLAEARQDGRDEGYKEAKAEDQEQLSMKDEQIRQVQERNRQLEEENRRLRGE
jgi:PHD/YefM family antitoxin component YafN of YafNO toxin-antitoxin module